MTPAELNVYARSVGQLRRQEQELTEANLYSLGCVIRAVVGRKRAAALEELFPHLRGRSSGPEMDDEALYREVAALNRLFGGTEA